MTDHLHAIQALGQAVWLDNINRALLDDGELRRLIDEDGLSGVTSNPTIFEKAMGDGHRYDDALRRAFERTHDAREVFFDVAMQDIRDAADLLAPVFERTGGQDGYVSFELPPDVAFDARASVDAACRFRDEIGRQNVLIKVPGTAEGIEAFEELTARGVPANVTLLFSVSRYEQVAEAYLRGLERRVEADDPIDRVASVASFFLSRVDGKVDAELDRIGRQELKGRAGIANAKLAYEAFTRIFSGERWERLVSRGANLQRPLWASTAPKDPAYRDTLYVEQLIGPDTVTTLPDAILAAARDHAYVSRGVDWDVMAAHAALEELAHAGLDLPGILETLEAEGVQAFARSFDSLLDTIGAKAAELTGSAR